MSVPSASTVQESRAASRALLVAALAGVALFAVLFLKWYAPSALANSTIPGAAGQAGFDAWQEFTKLDLILAATAILGAGLALVLGGMSRRRGVPGWALLGGALVGGIGIIGAVLLLGRIIDPPGDDRYISVLPGAYVGLALALALAVSGGVAAWVGLRAARRGYQVILAPLGGTPPTHRLGPGR